MSQQISRRQMIREKRGKEAIRNRLITVVVIVAGALLLFFSILWPIVKPVGGFKTITPRDLPNVNDNSMGAADAPITITEYSDFQCPYCRIFWENTEEQLIKAYVETGKVRFEYRSFGAFLGPESGATAEATYCAGDQEKFWDMHDLIFANQNGENQGAFTDKRLRAFAEKLGLEMGPFNNCFANSKYADKVKQDGVEGAKAGIQSTPSFLINDKLVVGAQPFSVFQAEIDALLK